jgi:hypothetical protein
MFTPRCLGLALVVMMLGWLQGAGVAQTPTHSLFALPGPATHINDAGAVVGFWDGPGGSRGYIWTEAGGALPIIDDPGLINQFPLFDYPALRINDGGLIAGHGRPDPNTLHRTATWSSTTGLRFSEDANDGGQRPLGINADGTVVGQYRGNSAVPFIWTTTAPIQVLPGFGVSSGKFGIASDINDAGVVVGYCASCGTLSDPSAVAFAWTEDGGVRLLPKLVPGAPHEALTINIHGVVAGRFDAGAENRGAFLWSEATGVLDLASPHGLVESLDINDAGDIVATIIQAGPRVPYLYRNGSWTNINDLRPPDATFVLGFVSAINNHGVMTGTHPDNGLGWVLLPPEPDAHAPVATSANAITDEDVPLLSQLEATDADGDTLTFSIVSNGTKGAATITNTTTGTYVYTPAPNVNGVDTFTFIASDDALDSNVATISVTITAVNDAPIANSGTFATAQDTALTGVLTATDIDSPSLTFAISTNGTKGTATIDNATTGAFTYVPDAGVTGADVFSFTANDGLAGSNVAAVSVTIGGVPPEPGALRVTSPNGGEKVFANVASIIRWSPTASTAFDVQLSRNGGATYTAIPGCTGLAATATECQWLPSGPATSTARVRVVAHAISGSVATDDSDANFEIATAPPLLTVTAPNNAVSWTIGIPQQIRWKHNLGSSSRVNIELSRDGGLNWTVLGTDVQSTSATDGVFPLTATGPATAAAIVRVTALGIQAADVSNASFSIVAASITVTAPNTPVRWWVGQPRNIRFTHNLGIGQAVRFELIGGQGGAKAAFPNFTTTNPTSAVVPWVVNGTPTTQARIRVYWAADPTVSDISDVDFILLACSPFHPIGWWCPGVVPGR